MSFTGLAGGADLGLGWGFAAVVEGGSGGDGTDGVTGSLTEGGDEDLVDPEGALTGGGGISGSGTFGLLK